MSFRSTNYWRQMAGKLRGGATYATSTTPTTADKLYSRTGKRLKGDFVPVCVAIGMIALSTTLGLHTAKQQLAYSPTVRVRKKTRERLTEIEEPETVVHWSEKLLTKSLFRKVAHVQESHQLYHPMPDPVHKDAFAHKPRAETLKDLGVDPTLHY
ncbi:hypothetical protein HS088_TW08G00222 [Tripterygium wilfordii]|uniref:NFU1 iron-sulfur cluster protein n=1 Tax=Tripterygium wilfordii TaxID=458696 RepID=A0A7J7DBA9_TRIWF|nr:uncharacterized protein LOC120003785 [Tripterygium wilfordii]KAF5743637.1 hypothetical protein HS088_TW08G00222 [Tripterygium wilfordii]